ncbi:hypothetical protein L7F22_057611 [Adiantum nelumboides]|nr:hypothetical protein [Adiantum nelumboides]
MIPSPPMPDTPRHRDEVHHTWFLRGGLTPLCMSQVLLEMFNAGDLQNPDNLQETQPSWFWQQIGKRVFWGSTSMQVKTPGRLVVTTLVHERIAEVTKSIAESCWTTSCVTTMDHLNNICGGEEEASIIKRELIKMRRGKLFLCDDNLAIKVLSLIQFVFLDPLPATQLGLSVIVNIHLLIRMRRGKLFL